MDAKTMVDTGEELYLLKENVKPLKKGRMICQLRTALLAQDDEAAHHELLKQREKYETLLRSYEGSDRLEPWYEYILWVEQSFLGDGREGNLYVLLERCLASLAEDEGYLQDRRYIELWIKYIEFSVNPLDLYKKCHAHGIGKYCAFFYISWASEFEKSGDLKRADQVFAEGFKNSSQPIDELEEAHKNFQLRVARQVLSGSSDAEAARVAQRVALSKLKAHGHKKNLVRNVRVGSDVQHGSAGILQPVTQHGGNYGNVQTNPIEILSNQEGDASAEFSALQKVQLSDIPRREIVNKENLLEPGPWNCKLRNRKVAVLSRPQQPSFEVYQDEEVRVENSPLVNCSALKPRKLDDVAEFKCPIAVFEPEDPSKRPMYCKNKVYAGATEFSFEELRAIEYLKGNRPARRKQVHQKDEVQVENSSLVNCSALKPRKLGDHEEFKCAIALFEPEDPSKRPMYCKNKVYVDGTEFSFEELRAAQYLKGNRPAQRKQGRPGTKGDLTAAKPYGEEMPEIRVTEAAECEKRNTSLPLVQVTEKQNFNLCVDVEGEEDDVFGAAPHGDTENIAPELLFEKLRRVDEVVVKTVASELLLHSSDTKPPHMTDSSYNCALMSKKSCDQSFSNQSLTYNTKEVMRLMNELWTSPEDKKLQLNAYHAGGSESKKKTLSFENVDTQCLLAEQSRPSFEIYKDESVVHEQGQNGTSCAPQHARTVEHYKVSRNEVAGIGQMQKGSGSMLDPAHQGLVLRDSIQTLSSVERDIKMSKQIEASNENCRSSYFREDNIARYSAPDELQCLQISTGSEGSIPSVPSPGMTEEEEIAQVGTEMKENVVPEDVPVSQIKKRQIAGILQPSIDFPCNPNEDPPLQDELTDPETYYSNVTCNTQMFSCPLVSSTPLVGQLKQPPERNAAQSSAKMSYCQHDGRKLKNLSE